MRKILILLMMIMLSGCSSFGRGVAEAIMNKDEKNDSRKCEIKGTKFNGIDYFFSKGNTVKVLMIHGVGTHTPGYATRIQDNLAQSLGLNVLSKRPKDITLINPIDGKTEIGNLRVIRMQDEQHTKDLLFYELTWSDITTPQKKILSYDTSGQYAHKRAGFNHLMKKFLDDTAPDPMIYLMDKDGLILNATKQSTCWMLGYGWDGLDPTKKQVCRVKSYEQIKDLGSENIVFITHSLGSRILMDSINDIVTQVSNDDLKTQRDAQMIINELKTQQLTVFMMANQLPILQIGQPKPEVTNMIPQYCKPKGKFYNKRVFKKVNIVAFSDPNDLLSYDIPQSFVDEYIDSRMCPDVTNVSINISEQISAFGVGVVNPVPAHTGYDNDERVIEMISKGTKNYKDDKILSQKCEFIHLEE